MKKLIFLFLFVTQAHATIFYNHRVTRRDMNPTELKQIAMLGDCCAAAFLTENIILTAHHCNKPDYHEGKLQRGSFAFNPSFSFQVTEILEYSDVLGQDYQISAIEWDSESVPEDLITISEIHTDYSEINFGNEEEASKIFTLGFPKDRNKKATYAEGRLKKETIMTSSVLPEDEKDIVFLDHNISVTHCNSGGPIFTQDDHKLIGILRGGPDGNSYFQEELERADLWNYANSIPYIYKKSPVLKALFPRTTSTQLAR